MHTDEKRTESVFRQDRREGREEVEAHADDGTGSGDGAIAGRKATDITGQKFGRLTVIRRDGYFGKHVAWRCRCDCGSETRVEGSKLRLGRTQSCGCSHVTHGNAKVGHVTPMYRIWLGMRSRCMSPQSTRWSYYGARGIKICKRWDSFENFLADMGARPSLGHSIDRINNDGNYEPGNCRWATMKEQCGNRRKPTRK